MSNTSEYYKPKYTKEEADEIVGWFRSHKFKTPLSEPLQLTNGVSIKDLDKAISGFCHLAENYHDNTNYSGEIQLLYKLRKELTDKGLVME